MTKPAINFFSEDIAYTLKNKNAIRAWILNAVEFENHDLEELNFIFCSDRYLLDLNQVYLSHDTYTDVITFDHSEAPKTVHGDVFISIDRIRENALSEKVTVSNELHRVMIHGTLHLLGYKDKNKKDKKVMTQMEDHYLSLLKLTA